MTATTPSPTAKSIPRPSPERSLILGPGLRIHVPTPVIAQWLAWGSFFLDGPKAAQHDGAIRAALEKLGQPIGVNDMYIAAHERSEGLVLLTNNLAEFARVPALETENWIHTAQ